MIQILKIIAFIPTFETAIIFGGLIASALFGISYLTMPFFLIAYSMEKRRPRGK
ncbi:MAG: hypothetical protein V1857_04330 [archaeon]